MYEDIFGLYTFIMYICLKSISTLTQLSNSLFV